MLFDSTVQLKRIAAPLRAWFYISRRAPMIGLRDLLHQFPLRMVERVSENYESGGRYVSFSDYA